MLALWNEVRLGMAYLSLVKDPSQTDKIFDVSEIALQQKDQRSIQLVIDKVMADPEFRKCFEERYIMKDPCLEELSLLPEGTLGKEYANHMKRNNLSVDFYRWMEPTDPIHYLSLRLRQTHDIWHTVTGFDVSVPGELGLQAFSFGQMLDGLAISIISGGLLHLLRYEPHLMEKSMELIFKGYEMGKTAQFFPSIRWENYWSRPLKELRADLLVN
jgi:ubiquinone biosynthesis protein Coq4